MKTIAYVALIIGALSLVVGAISRLSMAPVPVGRGVIEAQAFLAFSHTCILTAIAFILLEILNKK